MNLFEFFGKPLDLGPSNSKDKDDPTKMEPEEREQLATDVFHYIINDDDIHKKMFLPLARKIHKNPAIEHKPDAWLPIVNKGCIEFYKEHKMMGDPLDLFDKEFRGDLCKKLADFNHKHILMGEYNLGK